MAFKLQKFKIRYITDTYTNVTHESGYAAAAVLYYANIDNLCYIDTSNDVYVKLYMYTNSESPISCFVYRLENGTLKGVHPVTKERVSLLSIDHLTTYCVKDLLLSQVNYNIYIKDIYNILELKQWHRINTEHPNVLYYITQLVKNKLESDTLLESRSVKCQLESYMMSEWYMKCKLCSANTCLRECDRGFRYDNKTKMMYVFGFPLISIIYNSEIKYFYCCKLKRILKPGSFITSDYCAEVLETDLLSYRDNSKALQILCYIASQAIILKNLLQEINWCQSIAKRITLDFILGILSLVRKETMVTVPALLFPIGAILAHKDVGTILSNIAVAMGITEIPSALFRAENSVLMHCVSQNALSPQILGALKSYYSLPSFPTFCPLMPACIPNYIHDLQLERKHSEDFTCPVCLGTEFMNKDGCNKMICQMLILPCGHFVCYNCYLKLTILSMKCPICKEPWDKSLNLGSKIRTTANFLTLNDKMMIPNLIDSLNKKPVLVKMVKYSEIIEMESDESDSVYL